jgi:hypothetical protein
MNYEQAWGATLEAWPTGSVVFNNAQVSNTINMPMSFLPHTLNDVIQAESPMTDKVVVDKDQMKLDLIRIRDQANQAFMTLAQFTTKHDLGLALNKISGIVNTTDELIKKYN